MTETPATKTPRGRRPRVLVVDDEEAVRRAAERLLSHLGYETIGADCAEAAWGYLSDPACKLDLALIDHSMPATSGTDLLRRVRQAQIAIPILMVSGYGIGRLSTATKPDARTDWLEKPYRLADLRDKVAELLDRAGRSPGDVT